MSLRALGGAPQIGDKFVRYVYLDESGTGDLAKEPNLVVAGVIVNADKQLKKVENHLLDLVQEYVPSDKQEGFYFHAKVLANGETGGVFDRKNYPEVRRLQALQDLCAIPKKFDLPVVWHASNRARVVKEHPGESIQDVTTLTQSSCSIACLLEVEAYMRKLEDQEEVATLVYENTQHVPKHVKEVHNYMRKRSATLAQHKSMWSKYVPLTRIAETAFYVLKEDSSILQVADAVAFTLNKQFREKPGNERFISQFRELVLEQGELSRKAATSSDAPQDAGNA